ncbi:hypothetical protein [Agrobacterium pusense]|uniref:hypothetical protein n=1 Tax=Agrobacterium pusense TaxID=648995 RepID=UPI00289987E9|nr:hypothetical protein [Agrobacterium pusense]
MVNTHWHFDHADGNDWLGREGAKIIAHEMTLKHLSTAQRVEDWNFDFPPSSILRSSWQTHMSWISTGTG